MPTNRIPIKRPRKETVLTPEAIAAWMACDWSALHAALGLNIWERSPLPREISGMGCSENDLPADAERRDEIWVKSLLQSIDLQRKLLTVAGWPDCRDAYEENLRKAEQELRDCRELVKHPERDFVGSDNASRREYLAEAEAEVAYRKQLLAGLKAKDTA
jgi:hypothetical protein